MKLKYNLLLLVLGLGVQGAYAQVKVGDNPTTINTNSILELEATNKGLLLPRVSLSAINNASPLNAHIAGMTVYNTATTGTAPNNVSPGFYYNDGTRWVKIADSSKPQNIYTVNGTLTEDRIVTQGPSNLSFTSSASSGTSHFTVDGTTFNVDAVNNRVGIGTSEPTKQMDINGETRIRNIPNGTATDAVITTDADGNIRQRTPSQIMNTVTANSGEQNWIASSPSNYVYFHSDNTPVDLFTFQIPAAGTYFITFSCSGESSKTQTTSAMQAFISDNTNTPLGNPVRVLAARVSSLGDWIQGTGSSAFIYTASGVTTLKIRAQSNGTSNTNNTSNPFAFAGKVTWVRIH